MSAAKGLRSRTRSWAAPFPRNTSRPSIDGIEEAIKGGVLANHPVVDVKVEIVDGTFHEVDSSELAFKMAGIFAFKDAAKKASPILLEPIMKVEVTTPDEYQGDLLGDINRRRGKITHIEAKDVPPSWRPRCRWRRCLVTPPPFDPCPRAALPTPWSRSASSPFRRASWPPFWTPNPNRRRGLDRVGLSETAPRGVRRAGFSGSLIFFRKFIALSANFARVNAPFPQAGAAE